MAIWIILALVSILFLFGTYKKYKLTKNYDPTGESAAIETLTDTNFKKTIAKGVVLVDFWAPWCSPCRMLAPTISALADEFKDKAMIGKLNIDEQKKTATEFGIRSIPTVVLFKDGKPIEKFVGIKSQSTYSKAIKNHLA
jgi:thioredoxin 1